MPKGRKPKPSKLKEVQGNPGKRKVNKNEPKPIVGIPEPPDTLDKVGKEEYWRVACELEKLGLLSHLYMANLLGYCFAYSQFVKATNEINEPDFEHIQITDKGNSVQNPWVGIANKSALLMNKFASEFGMSPSAITRLSVDPKNEDEDNPYAKLHRRA